MNLLLRDQLGGRQLFTDPRIGDFSITFTKKDGEGEGLTNPVLQLKYVGDWLEIPAFDLAQAYSKHLRCDKEAPNPFTDCGDGPYVCHYVESVMPRSRRCNRDKNG